MKGYHILLGEDEPDILEYNREQLEQRGYQVTAVSTLGRWRRVFSGIIRICWFWML